MITGLKRWTEAADIISSEGFRILEEEAENEIRSIIKELRNSLDPRLAGKIDGIEWVFTTLCRRVKEFAEQEDTGD
ncbi:MAG: hypothetical protein J7M18_08790 [Candidatus Eremiobacteraeota bacterium]|nr:hypothetical protein [Candidatus Eremiobacteraeota bacterium]